MNFLLAVLLVILIGRFVIDPLIARFIRRIPGVEIFWGIAVFIHEIAHIFFNFLTFHAIEEFEVTKGKHTWEGHVLPRPIGREYTTFLEAFLSSFAPAWVGTFFILRIWPFMEQASNWLKIPWILLILLFVTVSVPSGGDIRFLAHHMKITPFRVVSQLLIMGVIVLITVCFFPSLIILDVSTPYPIFLLLVCFGALASEISINIILIRYFRPSKL